MNTTTHWSVADTVVIGGGIVGISTALELQNRGHQVTVIDPCQPLRRASYGNAGVISPGSILPMAGPGLWRALPRYLSNRDPALRIRWRNLWALSTWGVQFMGAANAAARQRTVDSLNPLVALAASHHQKLASDLETSDWLQARGWLRLYRAPSSVGVTQAECQLLDQYGIETHRLNAAQISDLEPALKRRFDHGVFLPQALSIENPGRLVERAWTIFHKRGGHSLEATATVIEPRHNSVEVVTARGSVHAKHVVLSAGAWSRSLAHKLGYRVPLIGERGYHIHCLAANGAHLNRPINDVNGGYVVAPAGDQVRILTGVELALPDQAPRYDQMQDILRDAASTLPLPHAVLDTASTWMGSRPSTPDGLPVLGRARFHDRVVFAFGHGHIGFSTGPVTGRLIADVITNQPLPIALAAFDAMRFQK